METEEAKNNLQKLARFIPNPYIRGKWYPATLPNGNSVEICKKSENCIWIRKWTKFVLKSPTGEILSKRENWAYFRGSLKTGNLVEL